MKKENDILNTDFIDFDLFVVSDRKFSLQDKKSGKSKSILIVYENESDDPELESILITILSAAKINIEEQVVFIKSTIGLKHSFVFLRKKWRLEDAIFFGPFFKDFGINYELEDYQPREINGCRFLKVEQLIIYQSKTNLSQKKALWSCLKEMYKP